MSLFASIQTFLGWTTVGSAATPNLQDGVGERKNDRAKNHARCAEDDEASDNGEKHGNGMQAQAFSDQDRVEQIVDQADDNSAHKVRITALPH